MIDKVYTSYFYKIRFFEPNMVPLSTAVWDPKWYHNLKGNNMVFIDKRGVINGLRIYQLHPDKTCDFYCEQCKKTKDPATCDFLKKYAEQLDRIDFNVFMANLENYLEVIKTEYLKTDKDLIPVFMVHEALGNPCSERRTIQDWFGKNGVPCSEWFED